MRNMLLVVSGVVMFSVACGQEEEHEHDASDFASFEECQAHYEAEGHSQTEIDDLCAALAA